MKKQLITVQIQEDVNIRGSISELHDAAENDMVSNERMDPRSRVIDSDIESIELSRLNSEVMFTVRLRKTLLCRDAGDVAIPKHWSTLYYLMPPAKAGPFLSSELYKQALVKIL